MPDCEVAAVTTGAMVAMPTTNSGHTEGGSGHAHRVFVLPGDRVTHELWGSGTVVRIRGLGALVEFDYLGHRLFVSAAGLEIL